MWARADLGHPKEMCTSSSPAEANSLVVLGVVLLSRLPVLRQGLRGPRGGGAPASTTGIGC